MNFRLGSRKEELEINLIPLIDVLLVILIFLMVTTTYSRYAELQINLPTADANKPEERPNQINVAVDNQGKYVVNKTPVTFRNPESFAEELKRAGGGIGVDDDHRVSDAAGRALKLFGEVVRTAKRHCHLVDDIVALAVDRDIDLVRPLFRLVGFGGRQVDLQLGVS